MTTSMFHRIQNQGFRANGMSLARRVVMDHSLMATAEQYTSANNRPGRQAMDYRKVTRTVRRGDTLSIDMVRNGGYVAVIE